MPKQKHKRIFMLFWLLILTPVLIIFITLQINQAHLLDAPGLSVRLKIFLKTNIAEVKVGATLPELEAPEFPASPAETFNIVVQSCQQLGWQLIETDPAQRTIQAVVSTPLMSFKDDITIKIEKSDNGSRLYAISRSRIGRGDLAANSHHLQQLLELLKHH